VRPIILGEHTCSVGSNMAIRRFCTLLLVLTACSSDNKTPPPPPQVDAAPPAGVQPTVKFGATYGDATTSTPQPASFNVNRLTDLWVAYSVQDIPDVTVVHISTYLPSGLLFMSYTAAYSRDPSSHPNFIPPGYMTPVDVRPILTDGTNVVMPYGMAISGTDYVRHQVNGMWRVTVQIDGVPSSLVDTHIDFEDTP